MGYENSLHIGPYMVVVFDTKLEIERSVNTCSNTECENHIKNKKINSNFCSLCGSKVEMKNYKSLDKIYPSHVLYEKFNDDLSEVRRESKEEDKEVFISNKRSPFEKNYDSCDYFDIDLRSTNISEEITWFKDVFKEQIAHLQKVFGEKSIEIKWGVIQWFS